jgi:hypothetical protein
MGGYEPLLTYEQAINSKGVIKVSGSRLLVSHLTQILDKDNNPYLFVGLSPSLPKALYNAAKALSLPFLALSDNVYPTKNDRAAYSVAMGRRAQPQIYPQHILSDEELRAACWYASDEDFAQGVKNRIILDKSVAVMKKATILKPKVAKTLRQMCEDGGTKKGCDLSNPVYAERLEKELALISEKKFDDYFFIVADFMQWAKQRMVVGPGRGSSSGSLVCYLLDITVADPIKWDLVFERFIDVTRMDYPDIDVDLSDERRELVFEYLEDKYGKDNVARLGTVGTFQSKSALKAAAMAIGVPQWMVDEASNSVIKRSMGDSRADYKVEDSFKITDSGRKLLKEYPDMAIAGKIEAHPSFRGEHSAGVVMTNKPVRSYVAVDAHNKIAMVDWQDAKDLDLLKIDILGLTQLSIFEHALKKLGIPDVSGFLESLPLDDQAAFDILNKRQLAGIFQFQGSTMHHLMMQINRVDNLEDIVSMTALCRPGPLGSGGTQTWINRKNGVEAASVWHPMFWPYLEKTFGVMVYQEQVMKICREIGDMSWHEVTDLRKAMGKSLGMEYFNNYRDKYLPNAVAKGIPEDQAVKMWDGMCLADDTLIRIPSQRKKPLTIAELYEKYEENPSWENKRKNFKPKFVSLFPDGKGRTQQSIKIIKSGRKACWRYEFEDGSHVTCTKDHRFIINGAWLSICKAKIGDDFLFLIDDYDNRGSRKRGRTGKGTGSGLRDNLGRFSGTGRTKISREFALEMKGKRCTDCGKISNHMEVHHNDFVEGRKRPSDLSWLCASCHRSRHWQAGHGATPPWGAGKASTSRRLVKITRAGMKEVYDISMREHENFTLQNGLVAHNCAFGMYAFNRAHALAYALITYYCCWLKAHHPLEFAAATLDAEKEPAKQIVILRELRAEGIDYIPIDPATSTDSWSARKEGNRNYLVGPLTLIDGIGPIAAQKIMKSRSNGEALGPALEEKLRAAKTNIDSLYPIQDEVKKRYPDLKATPKPNIQTRPTPIDRVFETKAGRDVVVIGVISRNSPLNENEPGRVAKRGYSVKGPTAALNFHLKDDTGDIFCKVSRFDFATLAKPLVNGKLKESIFAIKGSVPIDFRMIWVKAVRYLGELDGSWRELDSLASPAVSGNGNVDMSTSSRPQQPAGDGERASQGG